MPEAKPVPGRNEPCHCGSGRKYKQCCLEKDEAKRREQRASGDDAAAGGGGAAADSPRPGPTPKKQTQQPWKGPKNTKGFQKLTTPRRSGGS
jgi:SEC-C motif-containing protein